MKKTLLICAASFLCFVGCSKNDSSSDSSGATAGVTTLNNMQSKVDSLGDLLPGTGSSLFSSGQSTLSIQPYTAVGSNWTTAGMPNPQYSGDCSGASSANVSLKDWMGVEFDEDAVRCNGSSINVFGRIKNAAQILCAMLMSQSSSTSTDLPTSGTVTQSFDSTFTSKLQTYCGMSSDDVSNVSGLSGTFTFTDVSGSSSTFDRKININIGSGAIDQDVYLKFTSSGSGAIATNENNSNGTTRTIVTYDSSTRVLLGEYISRSADSSHPVYLHRLFKDDTNNIGQVYSFIDDQQGSPNTIEYMVQGNPNGSGGDVAFSVQVTGYGFGSTVTAQACVDSSTGDISTDNSTTCGSYSTQVMPQTAGSSVETSVNASPTTWNDFSTVPALSWSNASTMLSQGL